MMKELSGRPLIIGAGAAGLMAGVVAAGRGMRPILWEKNPRPGRKLAISGNGRGNYTNQIILPEHFHSASPKVLPGVLAGCDSDWVVAVFRHLGIEPFFSSDGRIFPASQAAENLVDVMVREIEENGGEIVTANRVSNLAYENDSFFVESEKFRWEGKCLTLATGGLAHPQLGTVGEGIEWLEKLGLMIVPPYPVLVPLMLSDGFQQKLQGVKVFCALKLYSGSKLVKQSCGEMLFTSFGVSGPAALEISGYISSLTTKEYKVIMDLRPGENIEVTRELVEQRLRVNSKRSISNTLLGLFPRRLIPQLLLRSMVDPQQNAGNFTKVLREKVVLMLRQTELAVSGLADWTKAQVSGGGASLQEVSSQSFACKKLPGLFLVGELLDVWGDSGGYNLHFAWISGYRAGENLF